jgi:hypothetical protein
MNRHNVSSFRHAVVSVSGRLLLVLALAGGSSCLTGCVTRYARVIALSKPPLATVSVGPAKKFWGPAPAYIDQPARFFFLHPRRRTITILFELQGCDSDSQSIVIRGAKWERTLSQGQLNPTTVNGNLHCPAP